MGLYNTESLVGNSSILEEGVDVLRRNSTKGGKWETKMRKNSGGKQRNGACDQHRKAARTT